MRGKYEEDIAQLKWVDGMPFAQLHDIENILPAVGLNNETSDYCVCTRKEDTDFNLEFVDCQAQRHYICQSVRKYSIVTPKCVGAHVTNISKESKSKNLSFARFILTNGLIIDSDLTVALASALRKAKAQYLGLVRFDSKQVSCKRLPTVCAFSIQL